MKAILTVSRLLSKNLVRNVHVNSVQSCRHVDEVSHALKTAGYRGECHEVKTEDGYILRLHRVLPSKHSTHKGSAFLMHGLFRNSSDFLASGSKIALAYYLSDHGYDVWLGNARGTKYSNEHVTHANDSKEFWKFSFHEIGLFDLPAMLDFMLEHTKQSKTFYVGHSQGTCSLLALLSSQPSYNDKINEAHLMTPAVFMRNATSPLLTMPAKRSQLVMVNIEKLLQCHEFNFLFIAEVGKQYRKSQHFLDAKTFTQIVPHQRLQRRHSLETLQEHNLHSDRQE